VSGEEVDFADLICGGIPVSEILVAYEVVLVAHVDPNRRNRYAAFPGLLYRISLASHLDMKVEIRKRSRQIVKVVERTLLYSAKVHVVLMNHGLGALKDAEAVAHSLGKSEAIEQGTNRSFSGIIAPDALRHQLVVDFPSSFEAEYPTHRDDDVV